MKNYFKYLLFSLITIFAFPSAVFACVGSYNLAVRPSVTSTTNGNYVNFTVTFSTATRFSNWDATFSYDRSRLEFISGDTNLASAFSMSPINSKSYVYRFKTKAIGKANFTFKINQILAFDAEQSVCPGSKSASASVTINAPRELSSNNYLRALVVDGYEISPAFNKTVNKYSLTLPEKTTSININATKEDTRSGISGAGKIALTEGDNTLNIIVTAENGASRTYTIVAHVPEPDPIIVKVDGIQYTVVRKSEQLVKPNESFIASEVKIGEEDIPALTNENLKMTLVGLRDKNNQISLFVYKDGKYSPFKMIKTETVELLINENKKVNDYRRATITVDDIKYNVYVKDGYYYFYAKNLASGKEKLYRFEQSEGTVQIEKEVKVVKEKNYDNTIMNGLAIFLGITYFIILINILRNKKTNSSKFFENEDESDKIEVEFEKKKRRSKN